jgi:hypothetical protein
MAKVTNAFASYSSNTNKEDLADVIYSISPHETPILNSIGRTKASNRTFEWSVESLSAAGANAQEEGFVAVNQAYTAPTRVANNTQILTKNAVVTASQDAIPMAGVGKSTKSHVLALRMKEIKRDLEFAIAQDSPRVVGNDSGTARKTRGFEHWIQSNVSSGTSYAYTNETTALTDGTQRAFTETLLLDLLETCFNAGAEPSLLLMGATAKRKFSAFSGRTGTNIDVKKNEAVQSIDVYVSDFGTLRAVATRSYSNRGRTVLALDPKMAAVAYLRDFAVEELAKTGDSDVSMIVVEAGLKVNNEAAHGKIADLTP